MAASLSLARRFWLAYLALAALFGAPVGTFIVLQERPAPIPPPPWSAWKPTAGNPGAAQQQIAEHVGARYRLPSGKKIVDVLAARDKRVMVAQILGQAYMKAHHLIEHNKDKVEQIAEVVIQKKEIYGDELVKLLNGANLQIPNVDLTDEKAWPPL